MYRKVASRNLSRLVAHFQIFRRLMKGKFDAYVLTVAVWTQKKIFQLLIRPQGSQECQKMRQDPLNMQ